MTGSTMSQDTLPRGPRLGRYEIRQMLGQGGMGQVYRAWDSVLKRDVAVKVLGTPDEELLARFAREAEAISQLDHANVVTVHDFQADPALPYIVMEYLHGEDLSTRLRRGPLPAGEAVDMILSVCSAVHACHLLGIIHRDLKPGNVFLHQTVEFGVVVKVETIEQKCAIPSAPVAIDRLGQGEQDRAPGQRWRRAHRDRRAALFEDGLHSNNARTLKLRSSTAVSVRRILQAVSTDCGDAIPTIPTAAPFPA
jgi:hypothetical protein